MFVPNFGPVWRFVLLSLGGWKLAERAAASPSSESDESEDEEEEDELEEDLKLSKKTVLHNDTMKFENWVLQCISDIPTSESLAPAPGRRAMHTSGNKNMIRLEFREFFSTITKWSSNYAFKSIPINNNRYLSHLPVSSKSVAETSCHMEFVRPQARLLWTRIASHSSAPPGRAAQTYHLQWSGQSCLWFQPQSSKMTQKFNPNQVPYDLKDLKIKAASVFFKHVLSSFIQL